jgi:hypothetical protein
MEFGMNYATLSLLMLAAQLIVAPASAKTPFDGSWDVAVETRTGSCEASTH